MKKQTAKKYIRRGLILAVLLMGFLCVTNFLNFLFFEAATWNRYLLHSFYERNEPIDRLWLGSSHLYIDVNPDIMDELSGKTNYNLATGLQSFAQSYLLLREANKRFQPEQVYLEMYFEPHVLGSKSPYAIDWDFSVWDYMPASAEKAVSIANQQPGEELSAVFLPFTRFRNYFFDYARTEKIYNEKNEECYQTYQYDAYLENGYLYWRGSYPDYPVLNHLAFNNEDTTLYEPARESLMDIIEYCEAEEISLTLFSAPVPTLLLMDTADYDQYVNEINAIADAHGLKYYDFNLCRQEYLPLQNSLHFRDYNHLNPEGGELFTTVLYDVITNDRTEYFYGSYEEKLRETPPALYGLIANGTDEEGRGIYTVASNREDELEYCVTFVPDSRHENPELIQDYSTDKEFHFSGDQGGVFVISARPVGENEPVLEVEIQK